MKKIIIAAFDEEKAIGRDGEIPWHYPEDLKYFKENTMGNTVIMGRKTYESLPEDFRPLPQRENIVLSRSEPELDESVEIANSLEDAYEIASSEKVFIAGGGSVYQQALENVDNMLLTLIPGTHDGDTFFPDWDDNKWCETARETSGDLSFIELEHRR